MTSTDTFSGAIESAYRERFAGDLDSFCALFDDNIVMEQPWSVPYGGTYRGPGAVRIGLERATSMWASAEYQLERVTVGPNILMAYVHVALKSHNGTLYGFPVVELLRHAEGRITELRPFHFDTQKIAEIYAQPNANGAS